MALTIRHIALIYSYPIEEGQFLVVNALPPSWGLFGGQQMVVKSLIILIFGFGGLLALWSILRDRLYQPEIGRAHV